MPRVMLKYFSVSSGLGLAETVGADMVVVIFVLDHDVVAVVESACTVSDALEVASVRIGDVAQAGTDAPSVVETVG